MSKKSSFKRVDEYIEQARALKKLGAIDFIPRREKITSAQKATITRIYKQTEKDFKQALKKPEDFAIRKVDKANAEILKKSGYKVIKGRAVIPLADGLKNKFDKVTIGKGTLTFVRKGKKNKMYLSADPMKLMKKAYQLNSKKGRNQVVSFSLGGNSMSSQDFENIEEMERYLKNVLFPKIIMEMGAAAAREKRAFDYDKELSKLWASVSIVTIGDKIATF